MATTIIYVSRKGNAKKIRLFGSDGSNNFNNDIETGVDPNDKVRWKLAVNSNLASLEDVQVTNKHPKDKNADVLLYDIVKIILPNGDYYFEGTVKSVSPGKNKFQTYKVDFKVPKDNTVHSEDPKLIMKT